MSRPLHAASTGAGTARPPVSPRICPWRTSSSRSAKAFSSNVPPRALEPAGVALVDKPRGPSSFAVVAQIRRATGAGTGHAGTLDPFATGLLLVLSGRATKLAPCLVGLDKRYVTKIDLTSLTTTGDPEGQVEESHVPPGEDVLGERLERLRGEVELPIPAASAGKMGGVAADPPPRAGGPGGGAPRRP